jgi:hypothetical protein
MQRTYYGLPGRISDGNGCRPEHEERMGKQTPLPATTFEYATRAPVKDGNLRQKSPSLFRSWGFVFKSGGVLLFHRATL